MKRPTLHKAQHSWQVGQYPLAIQRQGGGWRALGADPQGTEWLQQTGLAGQRFKTRRDCLDAVIDALELHGELYARAPAPCRKTAEGYRLDGGMIAKPSPSGSGWIVLDRGKMAATAPTLRQAAHIARARIDHSDIFIG